MLTRRAFLSQAGLWGCSAAASPFVTPVAYAAAPGENRLVVIILRGAMDGLDVIRPAGDAAYAALRPLLAAGAAPDLVGRWGLHPALVNLRPLWEAGEFGAVQAVSTPYRDRRSHFDGQDILEAGTIGAAGELRRDGWLNRMMSVMEGLHPQTAFALGLEQMLILNGEADVARWAPSSRLNLSPAARRLMEMVTHDDPLFRDATAEALGIVDSLADNAATPAMVADGGQRAGNGLHMRLADFAVNRLRHETRIVSFSLGGWDTHGNQAQTLNRPLTQLADTILALKHGLGPVWQQTAVLCLTEFGRTARENGSAGTDHGTSGAMLFAGGALRGGQVAGDWPGLESLYADRDLMPTRDVRAHAAWIMRGLFGLPQSALEGVVFAGLDMGSDTGLLL